MKPFRLVALALLALVSSLQPLSAQRPDEPPSLSDKASEELGKLREFFEQKKFPELIAALEKVIPTLANPSYDRAIFNQALAQSYLQAGNERAAIKPLEEAIRQNALDKKTTQDFRFFLAQLYYQFDDKARALAVLSDWSKAGAVPTRDQELFYAALLYDAKDYTKCLELVKSSLARPETPTEQQLMLKYAVLLELQRASEAAEILELIVSIKPGSAQTWQQLLQSYMAADENVRAIVTLERAMKLGHFAKASDYRTLVGLHYNLQQFPQVVDLIEKGFAEGKLPPESNNWELLAGSWMQIGDYAKAAEVYGRAAKVCPGGDMDFSRSQLLYNEGKLDEALKATRTAWDKANFVRAQKERVIKQLAGMAVEARNLEQLEYAVGKMRDLKMEKEASDFEPWLKDLKGSRS